MTRNLRRTLRRTALLFPLAVAGLLYGCSRGPGPAATADLSATRAVGSYRLGLQNEPRQPRLGDNTLLVELTDAQGRPVAGADVRVVVSMEAMGAMPRMESVGKVSAQPGGSYAARYNLGMMGEWDVSLDVAAKGLPPAHAAYRLSTSVSGLDFAGGTPAAGGAADSSAATSRAADAGGAVIIDASLRQSIGVKIAAVGRRDLSAVIRTQGQVGYDETRKVEVSPKFAGWVRDIRVDFTGRAVRRGDVLCTVYSPELYAAEQEYLAAARLAEADSARPSTAELVRAARERLHLWDIGDAQIDALERSGVAEEAVPILAPASGIVLEKSVVRVSSFTAGQMLYRIASVDPVWVTASVYQYELPDVRPGMPARILNPFLDRGTREGTVSFVGPSLAADTRTGEVRVSVTNGNGALKPGMFVQVELSLPLRDRLSVPASAVIFSGERRVVFVDLGDGRLAPRGVQLGRQAGDYYELLGGLREGERVVTSGNFLVASESRLKAALDRWEAGPHD